VLLGDDARELRSELERSFPRAKLVAASKARATQLRRVVSAIEEGAAVSLPLDLRGTLFQERVWRALSQIPPGQTRSYSELARAIEAPKAARAVAGACGRNRLAVLVPCHRAIAADGSLAGYRWGSRRKQRLLAREKRAGETVA
jgi:AraC family transcriptional regulator of adaptative response/methylated-DNA-[protein]-cysteine methyltransferase